MISPALRVFWQRYGLTAMLGLAAGGILFIIGLETGWGERLRQSPPSANDARKAADILATLPGFALPSLDTAFKETAERPLFTPTRRPSATNLAANVPAMKKGQFKLSGTSVNSDLTIAFLLETATGKTMRVTKGKEINGMTLDAVEANRVVLKQGEESEELTLRTAPSPPKPVQPNIPPPGMVPGVAPSAPVAGQPVAAPATPVQRPMSQPPNAIVPAPGSSQLPGFVNPSAILSAPTQAAPVAESNTTTAQRRRRFQTTPQQ